jgi:beta-lactam-binding protein with PASTA domain
LKNANLVSSYQGIYASDTCPEGQVVNQSPVAGTHVPAGTVVTWYLCRNPTQE